MARRKDGKQGSRRAKGEGGYWFNEKTGRHHYRVTIRGQRYEVADSDPERALAEFRALKERLHKNIDVQRGRQTLNEFLEYWLNEVVRRDVKESTLADYHKRVNFYIAPILGHYRLCDLTSPVIREWVNTLRDVFAHNSAKQALAILKRALNVAVEEHLIEFNPALAIAPPRTNRGGVQIDDNEATEGAGKVMTPEQVEALLQAVHDDWLGPLYVLAFLGLRRGELLGLRWKDYDKEHKVLRIRQQVVQIDGKVYITTPKTKSSRRSVPLMDEHIEMLDRHYVRWLERKMKHRGIWQDDYDLIFCTRHGGPIEPSNLLRNYRAACKRAGLEGFRLHDLRHTANQMLTDAGVQAKVRAAILGHASAKITEEVYTHASDEAKREAIRRLGKK